MLFISCVVMVVDSLTVKDLVTERFAEGLGLDRTNHSATLELDACIQGYPSETNLTVRLNSGEIINLLIRCEGIEVGWRFEAVELAPEMIKIMEYATCDSTSEQVFVDLLTDIQEDVEVIEPSDLGDTNERIADYLRELLFSNDLLPPNDNFTNTTNVTTRRRRRRRRTVLDADVGYDYAHDNAFDSSRRNLQQLQNDASDPKIYLEFFLPCIRRGHEVANDNDVPAGVANRFFKINSGGGGLAREIFLGQPAPVLNYISATTYLDPDVDMLSECQMVFGLPESIRGNRHAWDQELMPSVRRRHAYLDGLSNYLRDSRVLLPVIVNADDNPRRGIDECARVNKLVENAEDRTRYKCTKQGILSQKIEMKYVSAQNAARSAKLNYIADLVSVLPVDKMLACAYAQASFLIDIALGTMDVGPNQTANAKATAYAFTAEGLNLNDLFTPTMSQVVRLWMRDGPTPVDSTTSPKLPSPIGDGGLDFLDRIHASFSSTDGFDDTRTRFNWQFDVPCQSGLDYKDTYTNHTTEMEACQKLTPFSELVNKYGGALP